MNKAILNLSVKTFYNSFTIMRVNRVWAFFTVILFEWMIALLGESLERGRERFPRIGVRV